jgi:hypothetical protein
MKTNFRRRRMNFSPAARKFALGLGRK